MEITIPFTLIVSGQSGCGKTCWVMKLKEEKRSFFKNVIYSYAIYQPAKDRLKKNNVKMVEGLPSVIPEDTLLILDDMMLECNKGFASLFTRMRHKNSTIFIVQNLYFENKYMRTITRNASYMTLFPNPRDSTITRTLGNQMYPQVSGFVENAFNQSIEKPFNYLFLDLKPNVKFRVKNGVLRGEEPFIFHADAKSSDTGIPSNSKCIRKCCLRERKPRVNERPSSGGI